MISHCHRSVRTCTQPTVALPSHTTGPSLCLGRCSNVVWQRRLCPPRRLISPPLPLSMGLAGHLGVSVPAESIPVPLACQAIPHPRYNTLSLQGPESSVTRYICWPSTRPLSLMPLMSPCFFRSFDQRRPLVRSNKLDGCVKTCRLGSCRTSFGHRLVEKVGHSRPGSTEPICPSQRSILVDQRGCLLHWAFGWGFRRSSSLA